MAIHAPIVVIGAGIGGLAAAAALAHAGIPPLVLDAHVYPGGCAATFRHRGYWFDAGATLASGFTADGPMALLSRATGITDWPVVRHEPALVVHLPDGTTVPRWSDERRWQTYREAFGPSSLRFWRWQEATAQPLWELAARCIPWPPQRLQDFLRLGVEGWQLIQRDWKRLGLLPDAFRTVAHHVPSENSRLRQFVDAQLLITAQATSNRVNALYGAAALDFTNRGVVVVRGGVGTLATTLCDAIIRQGGRVMLRHEVTSIRQHSDEQFTLITNRGLEVTTPCIIANLSPWSLARLLTPPPATLHRIIRHPPEGWSAFVLYLGIDEDAVPNDFPLHHQILADGTFGEGHSIFLSLSSSWDTARAPAGQRALTASTHTRWETWWHLRQHDPAGYAARKQAYTERMLDGIARVLPTMRDAIRLLIPGTPVSFARFTRRPFGWVGGFPQTRLGRAVPRRLAPNLWLVGDSTFPGQSIAAAALGGLAVAHTILQEGGLALNLSKQVATGCTLDPEETDVIGGTLVDSTRSSTY